MECGMKETAARTGLSYDTLKFYCNEGLVPNVKRDKHNRRTFDDADITWITGLGCLRKCGLSIKEMKEYMELCLEGEASLQMRKDFLEEKIQRLLQLQKEVQESIDYIRDKQNLYQDMIDKKIPFHSSLIKTR